MGVRVRQGEVEIKWCRPVRSVEGQAGGGIGWAGGGRLD